MIVYGELTVGEMKEGESFINWREKRLYYIRGEYDRRIKKFYCRAYYRASNIRWMHKDKKYPNYKKAVRFKID